MRSNMNCLPLFILLSINAYVSRSFSLQQKHKWNRVVFDLSHHRGAFEREKLRRFDFSYGASRTFRFNVQKEGDNSLEETSPQLPPPSPPSTKNDKKERGQRQGYRFGDFTKSIGKRLSSGINEITGKDEYEFGDLTRWADRTAKTEAARITGKKDGDEYEFGDLTRHVDRKVKDRVNELTGKAEYEFGDLTKEIVRRIGSGDIKTDDLFILLKALLSLGMGLGSVSGYLPAKVLINLLNYSIAEDVSNKVLSALAEELDRRVKKAVTGDSNYRFGDLTRKQILKFIEKDEYSAGDITEKIVKQAVIQRQKQPDRSKNSKLQSSLFSDADLSELSNVQVLQELQEWDDFLNIKKKSSA